MILMALDHTRDYFHAEAFTRDPLDPSTTTLFIFFTRFITHFCAPVFVFLAGTSIYLQSMRKSKSGLSVFLFKRGLWLIIVELFLVTFAWTFDIHFSIFLLGVIWTIGISMVLMGFIIRLPFSVILFIGVAIVLGHNIFDSVESTHQGLWWDLLRNGNFAFHQLFPGKSMIIIYPFVPWLGLMMLGYCFGSIYRPVVSGESRRKWLINAGILLISFFVVLRFLNFYGDPFPWSDQKDTLSTILSFFNVHKYPPSLLYMCITMGPALIFLALFENTNTRFSRMISVYGAVPFFYYMLHIYLIHALSMLLFFTRGHTWAEGIQNVNGIPFNFIIPGEGYSIGIVYLIWALIVVALYPLCKWFSQVKQRNKHWVFSYL
jgi:uncharacterized membrane protein